MENKNNTTEISNVELLKFIKENVTTKEDLKELKDGITGDIEGLATQVKNLTEETKAAVSLYKDLDKREEKRDTVFANELKLNLKEIDAAI